MTTDGGPITTTAKPQALHARVEVGVTLIRVAGHAIAWNTRCMQVRWTGTNPEAQEAWVRASAVTRDT